MLKVLLYFITDKCDDFGCEHVCDVEDVSNTPYCSCFNGYELAEDGKSCVGE